MTDTESVFQISEESSNACIDVYINIDKDEIETELPSIKLAWKVGKAIVEYIAETQYYSGSLEKLF